MPSEARAPLQSIIVAGDGQVGLAAAIGLRKTLPQTEVTLVPCPPDPAAFADRAVTSLPRSNVFHERIGFEERALVLRAGASHRLGVRFAGWGQDGDDYVQAYGAGSASTGCPSVGQSLAEANAFAHPSDDAESPLSDIDYALRFNPPAYRRGLAALASHLGVRHVDAPLKHAAKDEKNGLSAVQLDDDTRLTADLFVDCTGPQALLTNATGIAKRQSWSTSLPCDRVVLAPIAAAPAVLSVTDEVDVRNWGWQSTLFGRDGIYGLCAYHSACEVPEQKGEIVAFEPGRLTDGWTGNVVAFGDAAALFEPLHWVNLTLAHEQILLFLELLPGRKIEPSERAEYNRRAGAMADRVRDFIGLHYCPANRPQSAFWNRAARRSQSPELSLTLSEYRRRGRLPYFEEELLARDAWLATMECMHVAAGPNALAMSVSTVDVAKQHQLRSEQALRQAMPYPAWLQQHIERQP